MGDIEEVTEKIRILELSKQHLLREISSTLTPTAVRRLCTSISVPGDLATLTITPIGKGAYGAADLLTYRGRQYIRKSQPIALSEDQIEYQLKQLIREVPENFSLFENEIEMLRELSAHPRLKKYVPVYYGHEREGETGIYLMEFIQGESLESLCDKRGLNQRDLDTILYKIQTILDAFHEEGYVFGDATFPNFFVRRANDTKARTEEEKALSMQQKYNEDIDVVFIDFGLTSRKNEEKIKQYNRELAAYEALPRLQRMNRPLRNRGDPGRNVEKLANAKIYLEARLGLPACVRLTPDGKEIPPLPEPYSFTNKEGETITIAFPPYKPRDYELEPTPTPEQEAQLQALNAELATLQRTLNPNVNTGVNAGSNVESNNEFSALHRLRRTAVLPTFTGSVAREIGEQLKSEGREVPSTFQYTLPNEKKEKLAKGTLGVLKGVRNVGQGALGTTASFLRKLTGLGGKRKTKQIRKRKQRSKARKTRKMKH